ncbi:MAG: hypothetical protein ACKVUS_00125 [Saprospiraceae bacterium]
MKQPETKGEKLHRELGECLASNPKGLPYAQCSRECTEVAYWVLDKGGNECFSAQNLKGGQPFGVKSTGSDGKAKKSWLVCVDEGLVTSQKSNSMARCDNLLFNDTVFYFVEAKMRVGGDKWKQEFEDAVRNKIPRTKALLDAALGEHGYAIAQPMGIAVPFPGANSQVPKINSQKEEALRQVARKYAGNWVAKLTLSETVTL